MSRGQIKAIARPKFPLVGCWVNARSGVSFRFVATDNQLMRARVASESELPTQAMRSFREYESMRIGRRKDGRCNVIVNGVRSVRLDLGFQDFMHGLLADKGLSLVAGEKGEQS